MMNKIFEKTLFIPEKNKNAAYVFLFIITVLFLVAGYIFSIVKHNQYLSNAWDLGIYNQYVYKFSHFKKPVATVYARFSEQGVFFLSDHVTLLLPFESMLYWLMGKNVLLYLQIVYIILGAFGLYKLIKLETESEYLSVLAYFLVLSHYSVFATLDFDYHTNVIGSMLVPWILYFIKIQNLKMFLFTLFLSLLSKEDASLILVCLAIYLLIDRWNFKYAYILLICSIVYSIFAFKLLSYFSLFENKQLSNWRYNHISSTFSGFLLELINNPGKYLSMMFNTPEKEMKLKYFLYTGGFVAFLKPKYLLPVLPNFILFNLSDTWGTWGNMGHYNIFFSVWIPYILILFINRLKYVYIKVMLGVLFIYLNIYFLRENYSTCWTRFDKILYTDYYHQRFNIREIKEMLSMIPANASVSASNHLIPHLAFRDKCYFFPEVNDADYIALIENDCINRYYYFSGTTECYINIRNIMQNDNYKIIFNKNHVLLLKNKNK
ncbi:MAG: DUF2079 domain-containing protein [Bacteroidia bacterium]|nr:DUF2079 domain-containing protein [Bacteroidia bacterium]